MSATRETSWNSRVPFNRPFEPGPGDIQSRRPFPELSDGYAQRNIGNSIYHSLQARFEKMFSNGLSLITAYTWSKSIDDASSDYGSGVLDVRNYHLNRGVSDFDHPHRFTARVHLRAAVRQGETFLGDARRSGDALALGGWQLGGILPFQSGDPFTVVASGDNANVGSYTQRPNRIASGDGGQSDHRRWFDPAAFTDPAQYTFGNSGRNILRTDSYANWDASLVKHFQIRENIRLQLRGEFFNVLNHPTFGGPENDIHSSHCRQGSSHASDPRVGQVALKLLF